MRQSTTLALYLGRHYLMVILSVFIVLTVLAYSFDTVELLRRATGKSDATLDLVMQMSLLKLPSLTIKLFPFATLFGRSEEQRVGKEGWSPVRIGGSRVK